MNSEVLNKNSQEDNMGVIYGTDMSEADVERIDAVEKIFVNLNRQILKEGVSEYLTYISKRSPNTSRKMEE